MNAAAGLTRIDRSLRLKLKHHAFSQNTTSFNLINKIVADWLTTQAAQKEPNSYQN